MARSENCPRTKGFDLNGGGFRGPALGPGPAYPVGLANEHGIASHAGDKAGWRELKTLWVIKPDQGSDVLIRGQRLDAPERLGFSLSGTASPDKRFTLADGTVLSTEEVLSGDGEILNGWRTFPTAIYAESVGCYLVRVDGSTFGYDLVFQVVE